MKKAVYIFSTLVICSTLGCSEFSKVVKSNDLDLKYTKGVEYFEEEECLKSMILFEELIPLIRGTERSEKVYYYYAKSIYCNGDYILAGYYFDNFVKTFPNSQFSEECVFLAALCSVKESPQYSLDQTSTKAAIGKLQTFVNQYPETSRRDTINYLVKELRSKLEIKAFDNARQYHHTRRYKSAVIALENTLNEFPDSRYREEMSFLLLDSHYQLAINSIDKKKLERLNETIESYHNFVDNFENSESLGRAEAIYENTLKAIMDFNSTNQ